MDKNVVEPHKATAAGMLAYFLLGEGELVDACLYPAGASCEGKKMFRCEL